MAYNIKVYKVNSEKGGPLANVSIEFENGVKYFGLAIREGKEGLWVSWPSRKDENGRYWKYILMPKDLQEKFETAILAKYSNNKFEQQKKRDNSSYQNKRNQYKWQAQQTSKQQTQTQTQKTKQTSNDDDMDVDDMFK